MSAKTGFYLDSDVTGSPLLPFFLAVLTSLECEQLWYLLQSEVREEISAHQRTSPQTGSIVDDHLGLGL
ncbi:hypothetical protein ILYODFUR_008469 [Ilyodon furcidens]|uniref:Uncharacterized protein n=1 Tax=Ilyodon furcidens TaxID=33524 RepID=A0ABV0SMI3_9TELE